MEEKCARGENVEARAVCSLNQIDELLQTQGEILLVSQFTLHFRLVFM